MKRIDRIKRMEECLEASDKAVREPSAALEGYENAQKALKSLFDYYGSGKWLEDYEADEAGRLPQDLKRGVLSEDTVYDLIVEHRELMARMARAVAFAFEGKLL